MIIAQETHNIAVSLGKSVNMRVTASEKFKAVVTYVYTPENDGAQQVINAGFEPTQAGIWKMVATDPSYPKELGTSLSTGQHLLGFSRATDPEAARDACNEQRRKYRQSVTEPVTGYKECNKDVNPLGEWEGVPKEKEPPAPLPIFGQRLVMDAQRAMYDLLEEQWLHVWIASYASRSKPQQKKAREAFFATINGV